MLTKLLIAAVFALGVWVLSTCAWLLGWPVVLAICAAAWALRALAESNPERWGWLFEWPRPPPPKPVDPAAMDGGPVF